MTPDQFDRAKDLFAEAMDIADSERAALVDRMRAEESPEVVAYFEQLWADYQAAEAAGFLDSPAVPDPSPATDNVTVCEEQANPSDTVDFISGESLTPLRTDASRPGPLLADDYEILDELGKGGMGTVYRAYQLSLRRHVAVKIIPTNLIRSPEESARFYLEAEAAASLDHPGIVQVQDVGERNGVHYYAMALVIGGSLADFVGKEKRLTRQRTAEIIEGVSHAVQYAHDRAVIHRDIKPANILLDGEGNPRLTDFGLAKLVNNDDHLTMTGQVMGTPSYMAPEQAEGKGQAISNRTDVYSIGATLYALLAGKAPFSGETLFSTLQQVQKSPPPPLPASVPLDLRTICHKCLEKNPKDRYESAGQLADDLRRYLDGFPIAARRVGMVQRAVGWSRRNPNEASLVGLIAATLIGAVVVSYSWYLESERNLKQSQINLAAKIENANHLEAAIEDTLIFASEDLLIDAPGMEETRRTLLENARDYFEKQLATGQIAGEKVADLTFRLGKIDAALGDAEAAQSNYDRAIGLYEKLFEKFPATKDADHHWMLVQALAQVHREYADLGQLELDRGKENKMPVVADQGLKYFVAHSQRCADLRESAATALPENYELQRKHANAQMNLGLAKLTQYEQTNDDQQFALAERLIAAAQTIRESIADKHPEPVKVTIDRAIGFESQAELDLLRAQGQDGKAAASLQQAALDKRLKSAELLAKLPAELQNRRTDQLLATACQNCGDSFERLGNTKQALTYYNGMREVLARMLVRHPGVTANRIAVARANFNISQKYLVNGNASQSHAFFQRCQDVLVNGAIARPDDAIPIDLLVEFTEHTAKQLIDGRLVEEGLGRIKYAISRLSLLPPASRNAEFVQKAIERLRETDKKLRDGIDDGPV